MRDHTHHSHTEDGVCALCGQPLPVAGVSEYGQRKPNRTGIAITVLLHLLLIAIYFLQPNRERHAPPPAGATMVYIAPLPVGKPKKTPPQQQAPKKAPKTRPTPVSKPVQIQRLPNTITLPNEKPVELVKEAPPTPVKESPPQETDMQAYIEARRKARGAKDPSDAPGEESENAKATRVAMANIAAANGRSHGDDRNESGGVFSITNKTFNRAEVKFRGWNPNFKRRWLQQVTVEQGTEPDIETAIINKMIELIRKEKTGDFEWDSHRLQRVVTMSARPKDTSELQAFLFKEMFPEYKAPRR
ncbi:hypothetical protein [Massilia sp. PWRC2]|uniref:hypothetical protein n=1 Tax=Massilia sp. PWRC2 TaxID=2804626 RepID=UPI003CED2DB1